MKLIKTLPIAVACLCIWVSWASAQTEPEETHTLVYQVKHVDAKSIASAVVEIEPHVRIAWDGRSRLVLSGQRPDLDRVIESIIKPLDVPQIPLRNEQTVAFIPLPQAPNRNFMDLVHTVVIPNRNTKVALDAQNRMLVVRGNESEIAAVRELVDAMNQAARPVTVTCYFLRGRLNSQGSAPEAGLPGDLKPVAATLHKTGLRDASLLAPLIINANDGTRFETTSALRHIGPNNVEKIIRFEVAGEVTVSGGNNAELMIKGSVQVPAGEKGPGTWFEIDTTIATRVGSYVVMAAAPSTTPDGDYIAMVARVDTLE